MPRHHLEPRHRLPDAGAAALRADQARGDSATCENASCDPIKRDRPCGATKAVTVKSARSRTIFHRPATRPSRSRNCCPAPSESMSRSMSSAVGSRQHSTRPASAPFVLRCPLRRHIQGICQCVGGSRPTRRRLRLLPASHCATPAVRQARVAWAGSRYSQTSAMTTSQATMRTTRRSPMMRRQRPRTRRGAQRPVTLHGTGARTACANLQAHNVHGYVRWAALSTPQVPPAQILVVHIAKSGYEAAATAGCTTDLPRAKSPRRVRLTRLFAGGA